MNARQIEELESRDTAWEGPSPEREANKRALDVRLANELAVYWCAKARYAAQAGDQTACHAALLNLVPGVSPAAWKFALMNSGIATTPAIAIAVALDQSAPDGLLFGLPTLFMLNGAIAEMQA